VLAPSMLSMMSPARQSIRAAGVSGKRRDDSHRPPRIEMITPNSVNSLLPLAHRGEGLG